MHRALREPLSPALSLTLIFRPERAVTTMAHELTDTNIFDVNGTKYRVGLDEHGYVQVQTGEMWRNEETGEDEFYPHERGDKGMGHPMFDKQTALAVADYIKTLA